MSSISSPGPIVAHALRVSAGPTGAAVPGVGALAELATRCADAVVIVDPAGMVAAVDPAAGLDVAVGDPVDAMFAPAARPRAADELVVRAVREGRWDGECAVAWRSGPAPSRLALFGHRTPQGDLVAVSVVIAPPAGPTRSATLADLAPRTLPLDAALGRALAAARALAAVHRHGLVHRDVSASAFTLGVAEEDVRISRLWAARPLAAGVLPPREPPVRPEGELAFISPELTGRMNRPVDRRSDLYSLGVVLYDLFAGRLPFEAEDPLEWVHCHVARVPEPVRAHARDVPELVDRLVLRLLAKNPDDRYQSTLGLVADLERCVGDVAAGRTPGFALGSRDVSDRFGVPQRLYGRGAARDRLLGLLRADGACALALVSGPAGIGKSSLVQELREPVARARGMFAAGKLDGVAPEVPYAPFADAIGELVQQTLAEAPARLEERRAAVRAAVGAHGRLLCDLVPRAALLLDEPPPVGELPLPEAQRRLQRLVGDVLVALAGDRPLVLFLDDLQWADTGTVRLLGDLVARPGAVRLLVVAAYRPEDLHPQHPLAQALPELRAAAAPEEIELGPLDARALRTLLAETLRVAPEETAGLASVLLAKTGGTPYFVLQFLSTLHRRGLIALDEESRSWRTDLAGVEAAEVTDNVVDLMTEQLRRLPGDAQALLPVAASLGDRFEPATLAAASGHDEAEVERALWDALRERLLTRRADGFRFAHDRVRQAAYELVAADARPALHVEIGRRLLARTGPDELDAQAFSIAGHLNVGRALITDPAERLGCAALDLRAGRRAMAAAEPRTAARYLRAGLELLPDDAWAADPRLALDLHLAAARCEHAGGAADAARPLVEAAAAHAEGPADIAAVAQLRIEMGLVAGRPLEAVDAGVAALAWLGVEVDADPPAAQADAAAARVWKALGDRPIETLLGLPPTADERIHAAIQLILPLITAGFLSGRPDLGVLLQLEGVCLGLEHGNAPPAPLLYAVLGSSLAARFGRYDEGRRLGRAAHALAEQTGVDALAAQTGVYVGLGSIWTDPFADCLPYIRSGFDHGVRAGDMAQAGFSAFFSVAVRFAAGEPLGAILEELEPRFAFADEMRLEDHRDALTIVERAARSLRGETAELGAYDDEGFDDAAFLERLRTRRLPFYVAIDTIHRLEVLVVAGRAEAALACAERYDTEAWAVAMHPMLAMQEPYGALARAMAWDAAPPERRAALRAGVAASAGRLGEWAVHAPANFDAPGRLVAAELARVDGRDDDAAVAYEAAAAAAEDHGLLHVEALALERAGRFQLGRGRPATGRALLRDARDRYAAWGAAAKAGALDAELPGPAAGAAAGAAPVARELDALAVARGADAISGELDLDELPLALLRIAVVAAGAQGGQLLLAEAAGPSGEELRARVVAVAETGEDDVRVRRAADGDEALAPRSVTDYVLRTGERVLLADATADPTFGGDDVVTARGIRSLLCQPIHRHGALVGLLSLEHRLVDGAFTADQLAAVEILAAQAVISLETARLYGDVREENRIRRRTEAELRASEEQFRALVESAPDAIVIADDAARVLLVNSRAEQLFGRERDALVGLDASALVPDIDWTAPEGAVTLELEHTGRRREGAGFPVEVTLSRLGRAGGAWTIAIVRDVTERKRLEHELEHAADHDALTGLFNRARLERELADALRRVERSGTAAVLLVLDLDRFRDINDSLGTRVGDEFIRGLAQLLRERLRPTDVMARLGGDEFAFVLSRTGPDGAVALAGELLTLVRDHVLLTGGWRVRTTASIGIAPITAEGGDAHDLLAAADVALDQAKEDGRDRAVVYTPDSGLRVTARHTWVERIRQALEHETFALHAQPILDLRSGETTHAELLLRMRDGDEVIPPAEFLPTAERTGLITQVDRWVIRQGVRLAAASRQLLELNLSAKSLADPSLADYIRGELEVTGADPAKLVFEITETAAIANLPSAAALAERLTALGCRFALDDFGVGFGSFYYLKRLPLHYIKIDGDFIQTLVSSPTDRHVTRAIVDVARGLGLQTIAEFVEDAETLELLRGFGVDYAQGFHVGRPAPVDG